MCWPLRPGPGFLATTTTVGGCSMLPCCNRCARIVKRLIDFLTARMEDMKLSVGRWAGCKLWSTSRLTWSSFASWCAFFPIRSEGFLFNKVLSGKFWEWRCVCCPQPSLMRTTWYSTVCGCSSLVEKACNEACNVVLCGRRLRVRLKCRKSFSVTGAILFQGFQKTWFSWHAVPHFRRAVLRVFSRIALAVLRQVVTTCLARSIDFEVANFGLRKKTCRKTAVATTTTKILHQAVTMCEFRGRSTSRAILRGKRMWWSFIVWSGECGGVWTLESTKAWYSEYSERFTRLFQEFVSQTWRVQWMWGSWLGGFKNIKNPVIL